MRYRKDFILEQNSINNGFDLGGIGALGGCPQSAVDSMTRAITDDIDRALLEHMRNDIAANVDVIPSSDIYRGNDDTFNDQRSYLQEQISDLIGQLNETSGRTSNIIIPRVNRIPGSPFIPFITR